MKLLKTIVGFIFIFSLLFQFSVHANDSIYAWQPVENDYYTATITIANGATEGYVVIPTSARGKITSAYVSLSTMTSTATTTLYLSTYKASASGYFWVSAANTQNTQTRFIGAAGVSEWAPLPLAGGSTGALYWIAKASAKQTGAKKVTITYSVAKQIPSFYVHEQTITIADGKTSKSVELAKSLYRNGNIVSAVGLTPAMTGSATTTFHVKLDDSGSTNYLFKSSACSSASLVTIIVPTDGQQPIPLPYYLDSTDVYLEALASGSQTGAKATKVFYVTQPY